MGFFRLNASLQSLIKHLKDIRDVHYNFESLRGRRSAFSILVLLIKTIIKHNRLFRNVSNGYESKRKIAKISFPTSYCGRVIVRWWRSVSQS